MLSLGIWILGLALIGLVLARACAQRLVFAYPIFYTYLAFVLFTSLGLLFIYWRKYSEYSRYYWYVEFAGAALGCGVVWEIYRHALGRFPGAARMARNALLFTLALTVSKAIANASTGLGWWPTKTLVALERDLRTVQAAVLVGLAIIIASYAIPLGRNLWGMMAGYALLISTNVITLTLSEHLGSGFYTTWRDQAVSDRMPSLFMDLHGYRSTLDLLPFSADEVIDQACAVLGVPVDELFQGPLQAVADSELRRFCAEAGLLDSREVSRVLRVADGSKRWYLLNLALWWRQFIAEDVSVPTIPVRA